MLRTLAAAAAAACAVAQRVNIPHGAEMAGGPFLFTNIAQWTREWQDPQTSAAVPVDANGWPLGDAATVLFDSRAVPAWAPPVDDPWGWQAPLNGTYFFQINGQANVAMASGGSSGSGFISNVTFDANSFVTSGYVTLPPGQPDLLVLNFTATKRAANAPLGSGFTGFRFMRPGHWADADYTWSPELVQMAKPMNYIRYMGITGTNNQPGYYGDAGHHYLSFGDRCLPSDAIVPNNLRAGCWQTLPWEYVVSFSQATGTGAWVNAPVSATVQVDHATGVVNTSTYVYNWAQLLKNGNAVTGNKGIPAGQSIYVEHSNEVWNFGFGQYIWNKLAAMDECNATTTPQGCLWNNDGSKDPEVWAQRRHIGKVYEIAKTFEAVFGPGSLNTVVKPIYGDWAIFPQRFNATLAWANATYGDVSQWLYGLSAAGYFGGDAPANATLAQIYESYENSTATQAIARQELTAIAKAYGIKHTAYEGGPGWNVGSKTNLGSFILAQRFAPMRQVVVNDVQAWAAAGGDAYGHFSLVGDYSRYGMWGHAEHFFNTSTPKYCALLDVTGTPLPAGCQGW